MFNFLDSCTLICGGDVNSTDPAAPVPENEAELSLKEHDKNGAADEEILLDPVDPMDTNNYLVTHLTLPMGILFEENDDEQYGGALVSEINEGCSAAADGIICRGDQLVAIDKKRVSGMDFSDVMKLILDNAEAKTLTVFRGPAESLYGPLGASVEWLDEFVAERGEEAALVEDGESEALPDVENILAPHDMLDDIACADIALAAEFSAYQTLLDAESNAEKELIATKAEEASVVIENDVDVAEKIDGETDLHLQKDGGEAEVEETVAVVENGAEADVGEALEAEASAIAIVEDDAGDDEEVASDTEPVTEAPVLNDAVNKASKDWLDNYLANPDSQFVPNAGVDTASMADEATVDLDARCKKAVEVKEAALAAVVENEKSNSAKGILKEPRYSPKGVDEIKMFESDSVGKKESLDDDSAASSVWSEPDDYIGQVDEEALPEKRVGSTLAALGVASTLTTNMMSA